MSSECSFGAVYHTSAEQKLKSRNAAKVYRYGTPNLRDLLREKCRIRIKKARQQGFSQNRLADPLAEQLSLRNILREELAELEHDITLQEEIYNDFENEVNDWFAEQLEDEQNYLIDVAISQELVCPICKISNLVIYPSKGSSFNYRCKCNANFNSAFNVESLRTKLSECIDEHEQKCASTLNFFVNPLTNKLEGMCDTCDYFVYHNTK